MLWYALQFVEADAPAGATVAWLGTPSTEAALEQMPFSEATHFGWHLDGRGRAALTLRKVDRATEAGTLDAAGGPALVIAGVPPADGHWRVAREFYVPYRLGTRGYRCFVWERQELRSSSRNGLPQPAMRSSSRAVQSQLPQAHASVPFRS
jgi:hypothetical protein